MRRSSLRGSISSHSTAGSSGTPTSGLSPVKRRRGSTSRSLQGANNLGRNESVHSGSAVAAAAAAAAAAVNGTDVQSSVKGKMIITVSSSWA